MTGRDDAIAELLAAGASYAQVERQLHVGYLAIRRVRTERGIPLPPGRAKRSRAELDRLELRAAAMLHEGATVQEIYTATRLSLNVIARLRREHRLPRTTYTPPTKHTINDALALYAEPHGDGHVRWTGPMRGRTPVLVAEGTRHSARAVLFRRHHHRTHLGYIRTTCATAGCIAGAHLADGISRVTTDPARRTSAITQLIELGASDWQIVCHLGTTVPAITRIRGRLSNPTDARTASTPGRNR